jgi:hypothetical protein
MAKTKHPILVGLAILLAAQASFATTLQIYTPPKAQAQVNNPEEPYTDCGWTVDDVAVPDCHSAEDQTPVPGDDPVDTLQELDWAVTSDALEVATEDQKRVQDYLADVRVADYLTTLVRPEELGGGGLDHVGVKRIFKNYTSEGSGKLDREGADEQPGIISGHNRGQAVDIAEAGSVTCKVVERSHLGDIIGGNKTKWQKPMPVKVGWQSREGIANNPTPHGNSLMEMSGGLTADAIVRYLNDSGEMDAYIDFVKGLTLGDMLTYVGANIYLKNIGVNQVVSDPLADSLIHIIGGAILEKNLPGLPQGIALGNNDDDARIVFAKARLEQGLNLPPGSLRGYGWNGILESAGKRIVENGAGLPALYLEGKNLNDVVKQDGIKAALNYLKRQDDAFNVPVGAVEKILNGDEKGLRLAGVNVIANALKMNYDARATLEQAVVNNQTPSLSLETVAIDNQFPSLNLSQLFSDKPADRQAVDDQLKKFGIEIVTGAAAKVVPDKLQGLTRSLLESLLRPNNTVKMGELKQSVGSNHLAGETGSDSNDISSGRNNQVNQAIAQFFNQEFSLEGVGAITASDVSAMRTSGDVSVVKKIGGAQADKAVGWNPGTGLALINGTKKLDVAATEIFGNSVGRILGLETTGISLQGNITENYGNAILDERLGLANGSLKQYTDAAALYNGLGTSRFDQAFRLNDRRSLTELRNDSAYWTNAQNTDRWRLIDVQLGAPIGTTVRYLRGEIDSKSYSQRTATDNLKLVGVEQVWKFFNLDEGRYRISEDEVKNVFTVLSNSGATDAQKNQAIATGLTLVGRAIGAPGGLSPDAISKIISAPNTQTAINVLLDEGIRLFAKGVGVNLGDISLEDLEKKGDELKGIFNAGFPDLPQLEKDRYDRNRLEKKESAGTLTDAERARLEEIRRRGGLTLNAYGALVKNVDTFLADALGQYFKDQDIPVPETFKAEDIDAFAHGDFRTGLAVASFVIWQEKVNPNLPADGQLSYNELRDSIVMDDEGRINARAHTNAPNFDQLPDDAKKYQRDNARKQLMEEARRHAEYKISDSFLRKADKTIPAGFSQILFEGTNQQKAELLQAWGINHLDIALAGASDKYVPGTVWAIFKGNPDQRADAIIKQIFAGLGQNGKLGPFTVDFASNLYSFISASNRADFFTNSKYNNMWSYFDNWLESSIDLGLGRLPSGLSKSIYYASQHNWDFDASTNGVKSLSSYGQEFLATTAASWGDKQLGLKPGTVYRMYQNVNGVITASANLAKAHALGGDVNAARTGLAAAQAALIVFVITTALDYCASCQKFFGSVDRALAAPAGFTNALVAGALSMAFGLGPTGLYIAAAIYLFGVYKVEYLCPVPPKDYWAISDYDPPGDRTDYGRTIESVNEVINPNSRGGDFADGNNPDLWMAWARYFTGKLLDLTLQYGEERERPYKPLQVLTYRQANAEFFYGRVQEAFGAVEKDNPQVGLGYTQTTTKLTDWVHVGFGGLY